MRRAIGVDLGGTKISAGIVDEYGNIVKKVEHETHASLGRDAVIERISHAVDELMEDFIEGIGITSPGFIDTDNGIVLFAGNIEGWTGLDMKETFRERYPGKKLKIQNDANMAALSEKWIGAGRDFKSFVMLTLGTGLGGAIYHEDMGLWEGFRFQGAEFGHMILYPKGRACNCGQDGCAEKYIAGSALSLNYLELTHNKLTGPQIIERLESDELARLALDKMIQDLAVFLVTMTNCFDPEGIILGGGFIHSRRHWWDALLEAYQRECNRPDGIQILPARFLNDSGIIGVAKTVLDDMRRNG